MSQWNRAEILYRLHYFWEYHEYAADYKLSEEYVGIPKRKRVTFEPRWVGDALDNAFMDEAFGRLSDTEQQMLVALYMNDGIDCSYYGENEKGQVVYYKRIEPTPKAIHALLAKTGMEHRDLWAVVNGALETMLSYLNK